MNARDLKLGSELLALDPEAAWKQWQRSFEKQEALVDPVGLNEMIRLLASDNLIPERKPWETFIDAGFLPAIAK